MFILSVILTFIISTCVQAVTTTYNWDVSWINANPDGKAVRYDLSTMNSLPILTPKLGQLLPSMANGPLQL